MKILSGFKTYYCNAGYYAFLRKWCKTDKDSAYVKVCDDMINKSN